MLFHPSERVFSLAMADLAFANPFDGEEIGRLEKIVTEIELPEEVRSRKVPIRPVPWRAGFSEVLRRGEAMAEVARDRLRAGNGNGNEDDRILYQDLVLFVVYFRFRERLQKTLEDTLDQAAPASPGGGIRITYYDEFVRDLRYYLDHAPAGGVTAKMAAHWFAGFFQLRRAFMLIHTQIIGASRPIAKLRANVWQSIFTHDLRRYRHFLYDRMHDFATLITGPSGTGKDLVAAAIGLSRYVAFDAKAQQFEEDFGGAFHPVNLSALPPQLIESELFGHCKGAFTGAVKDRIGWLESCKLCHSVFLDEIGELSPAIQVKLLRVLQNRTLQRLGETEPRRFEGKVIAATNRDLGQLIADGVFRRDFYYRLCSDLISTPSLVEQLRDDPNELGRLVQFIARRLYGDPDDRLSGEIVDWIVGHLGADYAWPGNIRELEQCVRNVIVRGEYIPLRDHPPAQDADFARIATVQLTADDLLTWYCRLAYARTGSFVDAAERLGIDRRTVRRRAKASDAGNEA